MTPKRFLLVLLVIIVLLAAGGAAYYKMSRDTFDSNTVSAGNGEQLTDEAVADLIKAVSKHMILPEGEEPVAAQIIDVDELLKTQPFYRGAINGDMLLIYQASAKAILYSPSRDLLVNVGPIVLDEEAEAQAEGDNVTADAPIEEQPTDGPVETQ